jgi:alkaline phosphatase
MQLAHEVAASRYLYGADNALSFHGFPAGAFVTTWDVTGYNSRAAALGLPPYSPGSFDPKLVYDPALGGEAPYPILPDTPERREYLLGGPVPDSASTATAMSTGQKTDYSNIGWKSGDAPGGELELISETLRRVHGMAIGLVTTVPISHATPASFFTHNIDRGYALDIGRELLLESRPEVVIGGGVGATRGNQVRAEDLTAALSTGRWTYVERTTAKDGGHAIREAAKIAIKERKGLIGIFGAADGNFESPVPRDTPGMPSVARGSLENPTLADASVAALEVLSQDKDGFFLMVEQGDIDWSNHANDFRRMIGCVWDLDEAVRAITEFVDRPDDAVDWSNTLVLVTADHANSYLRFNQALGAGDLPAQLGATYPDLEVSYGTFGHTKELVTLRARGRGAESVLDYATQFPGLPIVDNTDVYRLSLAAATR